MAGEVRLKGEVVKTIVIQGLTADVVNLRKELTDIAKAHGPIVVLGDDRLGVIRYGLPLAVIDPDNINEDQMDSIAFALSRYAASRGFVFAANKITAAHPMNALRGMVRSWLEAFA